ncbi:MBL fold metallo-hydrolase [Pseudahrensia aquimaris]|uniref:MBL fold metallo-hydrolase n=1 Tax=Pseudahrensia aquimaris TaxID=744461 RepID=A0ABW3FHV9_9HYPH
MPDTFSVKFWGSRGSMSSSSNAHKKYGGNTACIEMRCGDNILIFDAGSGLRLLGNQLMKEDAKRMHLFFTHCHYDHISGMPFFSPFFYPKAKIDIWSGHLQGKNKTQRMIADYMRPPYFPVGPEVFSAKIKYHDFEPEDRLKPVRGVTVDTLALNHHDGCVGYKVKFQGRTACLISDVCHIAGVVDQTIVDFVRDADLMIYDATYTDAEFPKFANFGHSTWQHGIRICKEAGVKRYVPFHHRPSRTDKALDKIAEQAKRKFKRTKMAREGLVIRL